MVNSKTRAHYMSQKQFNLVSVVLFGLIFAMTGCSGSESDESAQLIVVPSNDTGNGNEAGSNTEGVIDDAPEAETDSAETDAGENTDSSNTDATTADTSTDTGATTDVNQSTAGQTTTGTNTSGTQTTGGDTADGGLDTTATGGVTTGTATDGGITTAGSATNGSTSDAGMETSGMSTADDGTTVGTATDTGTSAGNTTDANSTVGNTDTDGENSGTTAGTDTDGGNTGTSTSGTTSYSVGSLAYQIQNQEDLSSALAALQAADLDEAINFSINEWTLFLPTNEAFAALESQSDFDIQAHMNTSVFTLDDLSSANGLSLTMDDGRALTIEGSVVTQDLTIANATVIRGNITGNTGSTVVHVIDKVIGDSTGPDFPSGSLGADLFERGDLSLVLELLAAEGANELLLIDPRIEQTLFLPIDSALDGAQSDFLGDNHIHFDAVLTFMDLTGMSGSSIEMIGGDSFEVGGGTANTPLTIGGIEIIESDLRRDDMEGVVVHIIDGVLVPE